METKPAPTEEKIEEDPDIIELADEDVNPEEDLEGWTKNKLRGFRRVTPSTPSAPKPSNPKVPAPKKAPTVNRKPTGKNVHPPPPAPTTTHSTGQPSFQPGETELSTERKQYCHYFVNRGECRYEERAGEICKFAHEQAPMCRMGTGCTRFKCMYSHPNVGGNRTNMPFLDRSKGVQQMMNPWQMINPWLNPFQQTQNQWARQ